MGGGGVAPTNTIAVLPLQNINGDFSVDFLRFALADEISNVLTYTRTLDVRPSSITRKYASADVDPQQVGRQLHVAHVLTGHFLKEGDRLRVTLEAVDVVSDRLFWQTNISASSQDLISLQDQLGKAYAAAQALVKRRPESAQAHFALSYVLRYAGMLEQSVRECDTTLALDPTNYLFRSCAYAFMDLGKTGRAKDFVELDAGSEWANYVTPSLLLREGRI